MNKTKIIENGVYSEDGRTLVGFIGNPEELVIVPGTFRIAREACSYCKTLKRVVIPPSLEFMNANCFKYCTSLSEVVFMRGSKLRFIENEVFLVVHLYKRLSCLIVSSELVITLFMDVIYKVFVSQP